MYRRILTASVLSAAFLSFPACSTAPKSDTGKADLSREVDNSLARLKTVDPTLQSFLDKSYGYAIFPTVGKGAAGVGGAYGRGELFEQGARVGFCDLSQATIGLQLGGQAYTQLIAFENKEAIDRFKYGKLQFAAQASAVALKSGASANAKYTDGVAVFTIAEQGLMFEASLGGQSFSYEPR